MEYVYAALLLHKAGQEVSETHVTKVLEAAGAKVDHAKVKALVNALQGVDVEKTIKEASIMPAGVMHAPAEQPKHEERKKEEKKVDEKKSEEAAAAGLGALFG